MIESIFDESCSGLINRVSDAADPVNCKRCLSILNAARLLGIPIFNGPDSYSLACSKWCHSLLFQRAGCAVPSTMVIAKDSSNVFEENTPFNQHRPLLIKPNAGGFGAGIVKVDSDDTVWRDNLVYPSDETLLLQDYYPVSKIYRVWFLLGKVQCAVERTVSHDDDFGRGCTASACAVLPGLTAWPVPVDVRTEIEHTISLLKDAHAGSVEFLVDDSNQRQYFDFNLLSTLPLETGVENTTDVWGLDFNPWRQLADSVRLVLQQ